MFIVEIYTLTLEKDYNNFHRIDLHKELIRSAFEEPGEGPPCTLKVNHKAITMDPEAGTVTFENGTSVSADLIVAADGIRVRAIHRPPENTTNNPSP